MITIKKINQYIKNYINYALKKDQKLLIGKKFITLDYKHSLPTYMSLYPNYSSNITRLSKTISKTHPNTSIIDVGANVGDTVALIRKSVNLKILCIEGDSVFLKYLYQNIKNYSGIDVWDGYVSDLKASKIGLSVSKSGGTAKISVVQKRYAKKLEKKDLYTLDQILQEKKEYSTSKILKIDTDGYDFKILKGSKKFLINVNPVLFFEYDINFSNDKKIGLKTLTWLSSLGYYYIVYYDNFGKLLGTSNLENSLDLKVKNKYIEGNCSPINYYDIVLFHKKDKKLYDKYILSEFRYFDID